MEDQHVAGLAKALGHPVRVRILRMLAEQDECMGTQLFGELPLAQSTVSQHLALLKAAGLVSSHAVGQGNVYCLNAVAVASLSEALATLAAGAPACDPKEESR